MDDLNEESIEGQRQRIIIKDYKLKTWKSMWRTCPEMKSWISKWQNILQGKSIAWGAERSNHLCQIMLVKLLEVKRTWDKKNNI